MRYPRLYTTQKTHDRVMRAAKKAKVTQKVMGEKVAKAGLQALGL